MSVTTTLIDVIDYDCDLHEWVREVAPELWEASLPIILDNHSYVNPGITKDDMTFPVQLYVNSEYGGINCYTVDKFDNWYSTRVGHTDWSYSWVCEPKHARSYDDCYPGGVSFKTHPELISFIARGRAESTDEDISTSYHRISNPMCDLPQFQSFRKTELCHDRYTPSYCNENKFSLTRILRSLRYDLGRILSPFRLIEDEYGDVSRPVMDTLRSIWRYSPHSQWPGQYFTMKYTSGWNRYSSPDEEYYALMRISPYRRDDIEQYWSEIKFNSECWRSYLLMPEVFR